MARKRASEVLTCSVHADCTFAYKGFGRPPKFCEKAKAERVKKQRKDARDRRKKAKKSGGTDVPPVPPVPPVPVKPDFVVGPAIQ